MNATTPLIPPATFWLVGVLLGAHFLQWTVFTAEVMRGIFAFQLGNLDAGRWWSVATYAVVQPSVLMLGLNAYVLLLFGPRLEQSWGAHRLLGFVALAALGGWMVHLFVGGTTLLLGASAVGFGMLGAYAMQWGREERMLPGVFTIRVRWLAAVVGAVVLLTGLQEPVGGGAPFFAHLGGLGAAWVFGRAPRVMFVERFRDGVLALPDDPPEDQLPRAVPKISRRARTQQQGSTDNVVARTNAEGIRQDAAAPSRVPALTGEKAPPLTVDAILDKISAEGIDRLTLDERRVLDDQSRRLRDNT